MESLPLGTYQPGQTLLHRFDPRLKQMLCGLLVILTFAATDGLRLVIMLSAALFVLFCAGQGLSLVFRLLWPFRWLFLFTIVLHACLSPGYTLFGISWLSKDGLMLGYKVCVQVGIALLLASLLALTTRPEMLARAFGWFFEPLARFGFPVRSWEGLVLLTLRFIPVLRGRLSGLASHNTDLPAAGFRARWLCLEIWERRIEGLVAELVTLADQMARDVIAGKEQLEPPSLSPLRALSAVDVGCLVGVTLLALLYCLAGAF